MQSEYLIGRGPRSQLRLQNRLVSSTHAQLRWSGHRWEIHDLDSRNGTFVNGEKLARGTYSPVAAGVVVAFGDAGDLFELADDGPPSAYAIDDDGQRRELQSGDMLVLPSPDQPVYTIFEQRGRWWAEGAGGRRLPVDDGEKLDIAGTTWTLHLPHPLEPTWQCDVVQPLLREVTLRFAVSRDQEHIALELVHGRGTIALAERTHMEMLLRLAEARMRAGAQAIVAEGAAVRSEVAIRDDDDEGWIYISDLLGRLGLPDGAKGRNLVCQHVYQARKQFAETGIVHAVDIVQRRNTVASERSRRAGQIRLGTGRVNIVQE